MTFKSRIYYKYNKDIFFSVIDLKISSLSKYKLMKIKNSGSGQAHYITVLMSSF